MSESTLNPAAQAPVPEQEGGAMSLSELIRRLRRLQAEACGRDEGEEFPDEHSRLVWSKFNDAIQEVKSAWPDPFGGW